MKIQMPPLAFPQGGIVAFTYCVDNWWSEYGNQTLDILDTLSFDQDIKEGGAYVYSEESRIEEIGLSFSLKNISSELCVSCRCPYD